AGGEGQGGDGGDDRGEGGAHDQPPKEMGAGIVIRRRELLTRAGRLGDESRVLRPREKVIMRKAAISIVLSFAAVAAAGDPAPSRGIEAGDLDRSADACTDFFQFANGTWRASHPIPDSMTRWSRRWAAGETAKEQLKTILDEVSASRSWPPGSVEQLIGDFHGSCMDEARIDALGLKPIQPLLAEIDALPDPAAVPRMIGRFHELAINVPFGVVSAPDNHQPSQVIADVFA